MQQNVKKRKRGTEGMGRIVRYERVPRRNYLDGLQGYFN